MPNYSYVALKKEVKAKGLVKTAAETLKIPYNTFVEYLNGRKLDKITDEIVKGWCEILDIPVDSVFDEEVEEVLISA